MARRAVRTACSSASLGTRRAPWVAEVPPAPARARTSQRDVPTSVNRCLDCFTRKASFKQALKPNSLFPAGAIAPASRSLRSQAFPILGWLAVFLFALRAHAAPGFLQIRNGYFSDSASGEYVVPRGLAYQIWNPPVGANQSFDQVDYDLLEFKKMYANSVRCEFVWSQIETREGQYDWSKPDHLVAQAEALGLKLFVIIGFQYPPPWFPKQWRGINDRYLSSKLEADYLSDVLNYEHPEARRVYANYLARVTERYQNSRAIGAWILGNEYAYFDLWEDPAKYPTRRFLGYDPISQASFRKHLATAYGGSIAALNANWGTSFPNFDAVLMLARYPSDHNSPGYHDLIQWRKKSIGDFIALGALAAQASDRNHLKTYSMVGGIFNGNDANNTAEDGKTIVERCAAAGVPLDFWSINNYAWASFGSELRSADFGIAKYQAQTGLPVMISETGHSSTEDSLGAGAAERQAKALPSTVWESLLSGAIGVHIFHWNDRSQFTQGYFLRERGFGIVNQNRTIKNPVYRNMLEMFRRFENLKIERLLGGSTNPPADVQFFWSTNADMVWPRANQENAMLWGALKRAGYQPGILDDLQFEGGAYTNAKALLLSRCTQMNPAHLDAILNDVLPRGIHVHANADLPGQYDAYYRRHPNWAARLSSLFGLNVANAVAGFETSPTNGLPEYRNVTLRGVGPLGPINASYSDNLESWKIWHGVRAATGTAAGTTVVTHTGLNNSQTPSPALQIKTIGAAKTAVNTFALGDTFGSRSDVHRWEIRYDWLRAIYRNHFGLTPALELSGADANYKFVIPDYRICRNGSVLISLLNEHTNTATVTLSAPGLLSGKTVENLTTGGILETNSDGSLQLTLKDDDYVLLYAYRRGAGQDESLINASPHKIWFESAPTAVWPKGSGYDLQIGYDTQGAALNLYASFERVRLPNQIYARSTNQVTVRGQGSGQVQVAIPDADPNDPDYISSPDGGHYVFHAWLEQNGAPVSETFLPGRLLWGVHPVTPWPATVVAGRTYSVTLGWQELPSYQTGDATPLDRAELWDSLRATAQLYNIVLELKSADQIVAQETFLTRRGTDRHAFSIAVPISAKGPFTWSAYAQTASNVQSHDVEENFEGRDRGAQYSAVPPVVKPEDPSFIRPWLSFTYAFPNSNRLEIWQNQGVQLEGSAGSQSAFLVMTNPPNQLFSGFGLSYVFPNDWALPVNPRQWTNYAFSFDFKESHGYNCVLEMQVKNADPLATGKWIQFAKPYSPGSNQWDTVKATLELFGPPTGLFGVFEPDKVHEIVVNILMISSNAQYVASIDNIKFDGPDTLLAAGEVFSIYSSANDSFRIQAITLNSNREVVITWLGAASLQSANDPGGPWTEVPRAASPFKVQPAEARKFYRLAR